MDAAPRQPENTRAPLLNRFNLLLIIIILVIVGVVSWLQLNNLTIAQGDYSGHLEMWASFQQTGVLSRAHVVYPIAANALASLIGIESLAAGILLGSTAHAVTAIVTFWMLRRAFPEGRFMGIVCAVASVGLAFAYAIYLLTLHENWRYLGYIPPTVTHSPTQELSKPMTLIIWGIVMSALLPVRRSRWTTILISALLCVILIFTKPNYVLVLLPAAAVITLIQMFRRKPIDWALLIGGFVIPSMIALIVQFLLTYSVPDASSSIAIDPFLFVKFWVGDRPLLILAEFVGSVFFPVLVYGLYWAAAHRDQVLNFAWIALLVGILQYYMLIETAPRVGHGNWTWGAYSAMYIMYLLSVKFVLGEWHSRGVLGAGWNRHAMQRRDWVILGVFTLSVILGLFHLGVFPH